MYKDKADPEEYLLGKRVDSNFERQHIPEKSENIYCRSNYETVITWKVLK